MLPQPKKILLFLLSFLIVTNIFCQNTYDFATQNAPLRITSIPFNSGLNKKRLWLVAGVHAALWTTSYIILDKTWYASYPRSSYHFFNDDAEWEQMDKCGHLWTCYNISRIS